MTDEAIKQALTEAVESGRMDLEALIGQASELLSRIAPRQTRYKVSEIPDARTIRYYISQGLMPKPRDYVGGRANYDGEHVLVLLLIKKWQAENFSLRQIKQRLENLSRQHRHHKPAYLRQLVNILQAGDMAGPGIAKRKKQAPARLMVDPNGADPAAAGSLAPKTTVPETTIAETFEPTNGVTTIEYAVDPECKVYISANAASRQASASRIATALRKLARQLEADSK